MKRLIVARRFSQAFFCAVFVYILWSTTYPLTGLIAPAFFFKLDPLLVLTTVISERVIIPGFVFALGMIVLALIFGRFFCGWICPLGSCIDAAVSFKRRHRVMRDAQNRILRKPKFYILAVITVLAIFGRQAAWLFDPIVIMGRFVSLNLIPAVTTFMNNLFIFLIRDLHFSGAIRDVYRGLKMTVLGVKMSYFSHAALILACFFVIIALSFIIRRFWCRALCPLGALYALAGRFAPLKRTVDACKKCKKCASECRTGAIKEDAINYEQGECIMCMDCVYTCPAHATAFRIGRPGWQDAEKINTAETTGKQISRKEFLSVLMASFASIAALPLLGFKPKDIPLNKSDRSVAGAVIRPPAAVEEKDFVNMCVRCGNCMKVCITNGLQPATLESGYNGVWTPHLVPEIGYCEYHCVLCGNTCPTGAIPPLTPEKKLITRLGTAKIDRSICIPWAEGKDCIVCEEHCPIPQKAISVERDPVTGVKRPSVSEDLCIGCGICQNKCPVRPVRAVRVSPRLADRTAVSDKKRHSEQERG